MLEVADLACESWDFAHLTKKTFGINHGRAFLELARKLRPTLKHMLWPEGPEFSGWLKQGWPAERGELGLWDQYKTLARRIRAAALGPERYSWRVAEQYWVRPIRVSRFLLASLALVPQL